MKKVLIASIIITALIVTSCGGEKDDCKQCNKCATKVSAEVCEDNFNSSSDFNAHIDTYLADGCECKDKD